MDAPADVVVGATEVWGIGKCILHTCMEMKQGDGGRGLQDG